MPKLLTALVAVTWFAAQSTSLAPFVATPPDVVDRMLTLARTGRSDVVYDIGCGDGRIVIAAAVSQAMPAGSLISGAAGIRRSVLYAPSAVL